MGNPREKSTTTPPVSRAETQWEGAAAERNRVLVVDDEAGIRIAFVRFLTKRGFEVDSAASGEDALERLRGGQYSLMLCDVMMPGLSGIDVVARAIEIEPDLAIVMMTALTDAATATAALTRGASEYLTKPAELTAVEQAVQRALRKRALAIERRRVERLIRAEVAERTAALERERTALRALTVNVAETLVNAMEAKDVYLRGHSQRVAALAASIADQLGLPPEIVENVRLAGNLHDVGMIGVREEVLHKRDAISTEDIVHLRDHVRIGVEILSPLRHLGDVLTYVQDHHEHWDGGGYPRRLSGQAISIGGRILCAADAYDALTSGRSYRDPMEPPAAIALLSGHAGGLLDPEVFEALRGVVGRRRTLTFIDPWAGAEPLEIV